MGTEVGGGHPCEANAWWPLECRECLRIAPNGWPCYNQHTSGADTPVTGGTEGMDVRRRQCVVAVLA